MFGGLGVYNVSSYFVFFFFHHHTSHVARFNARGLLYESAFDALLFSLLLRPIGKSCF
jgi:hypothetical protein